MILPTKEECKRIIATTCQAEVNLTYTYGMNNHFPDCNDLPSSISGTGKFTIFDAKMFIQHFNLLRQLFFLYIGGSGLPSDGVSTNSSNVTCSPDFYLENSTCFPICQQWRQFSKSETALVRGSAASSSVVGILGGIAVIVGSVIRYKSM